MYELNLSTKQKNTFFVVVLGLVVFILWLILESISNSGKYSLVVDPIPKTANVIINGISKSKSTLLYPGKYEVTVKAEGFVTQSKVITVEKDYSLLAALIPSSDEAKKWVDENVGSLYDESYDPKTTYHPIQTQLPYVNSIFSISTKDASADKDIIHLDIVTLPGYRNAPINKIKDWGFNPEDYTYDFNYKNPFEK